MKLKTLLTSLILLIAGTATALDSGYYFVKSYNGKYLTENTSSHTMVCSDLTPTTNYSQVWQLTFGDETWFSIQNVLTGRYIYGNVSQFIASESPALFRFKEDNSVYTFYLGGVEYLGLHCDNNNNVVPYYISDNKSKWTLEAVTVDQDALAAQKSAISVASTDDLLKVFTTTACTELKNGYTESDLAALPTATQELASKIKDNTWETYSGWDKTEKTFRIADYKAYSSHTRWTSILGLGWSFGCLTNPTGISVTAGDYIQVYVGDIPSGQSVQIEVAGDHQAAGVTYQLKQGMNVLLMASSGNCFVRYEVDNTDDGKAPYTVLSSYTPVTVHIEGGMVQGYFDLTLGDDNDDWAKLQTHLLSGSCVDLKTDNLLFHMQTNLVKAACPEKMVELLGEWDKILDMEHSLMGLEDFDGYWNNLLIATDMSGQDYMHASTYGTYYDVETISSLMSYTDMFAGGALWGPAHENGHIFQKYINMVGQTEVSNNLFSNVAVYNNGHLTSRAANISTTFENMAKNAFWNDRDIWERTHLYFQLYQFFHILGKNVNFYPELFKAFRNDPMVHTAGTFISATDDYLKFYKKCCQVSGYDLTEFFQAYGFFVIPTLTSYTLGDVTQDAYQMGDYGTYYLTVTQEEIDAVKAEVAAMNLPKANIIFIEDRITAPNATYEGATAGTKKTAFSNEFPIGQAGETGQYTTFDASCSAYTYNITNNTVTMEGTGAVGFKVYDSTGNLRGLYNTYTFTLPDGIGTGYTIKAAAGNGTDTAATLNEMTETIKSDVTDNPGNATDVVTIGTQITSESGITSGKAYILKTGADCYITDNGTNYDVPNNANTATKASTYILISNGNGTWKIKNYATGKYWGVPAYNTALSPAEETAAGAWSLNFSSGIAYPSAPDASNTTRGIDRSNGKVWGWSTGTNDNHKVYVYEADLSNIASNEFADKDISVSSEAAASLQTNEWYVMFDRGAGHGYLYENGSNKLYNTATVPSGSATDNAKYLVRIVGWNNEYYLQTGLGHFFGKIQKSTNVPTTATATEQITIKKIAGTDGHFYLTSAEGIVLDANALTYGDATVVGWGETAPTTTGGNNDWAFYPVEFVESIEQIAKVFTINNTNTSRGALTYEPSKSTKYVWSSGKSGATALNAQNPNHQWVIIPTGTAEQYYLYNVGADKFAIPTGIAQSNQLSWVFSDNAVAVVFEEQTDGTKKIRMANAPVSGTNAAYMGVSNTYTGPIINWNDDGSKFTITKVDGVTARTQAEAAVARLVKSQTALTTYPQESGWYAIQIKSKSGTSYAGRYLQMASTLYNGLYPLTFTGGVDVEPAITDPTFLTYINHTSWDVNTWQLPDGRYLVGNSSNKFPTTSATPGNVLAGFDNGNYFKSAGNYFADAYDSNANYFIGETTSFRTVYNVYPVDLATAGLTAWQMVCENAPETAQISCTRSDVRGSANVYNNGYIFLPAGTTPESSDFVLDGATEITVNDQAKTVTLNYDPTLAIVESGVTVAQGYQTAGRSEELMLLKVNAAPFRDATGAAISVSLKDGSEANISKLTLYEASNDSPEILSAGNDGAPTKTIVAETIVSGSNATLSIGNLTAGKHYYWLAAQVSDNAELGAILDAAVTGITYTCNSKETTLDLTSVGDPSDRGAMVFNVHNYPFLPRQNGSRVYRIPAMVVADDGSIVVACDKRYGSYTDIGGGHVIDIVVRRSTDGGKTWSAPVVIAKGLGSSDTNKCGYGDPSLTKGKDGKLYCLFVAGNLGFGYAQKQVALSVSSDNGVTWSSNASTPPTDLYLSGKITDHACIYHTSPGGDDVPCYGLCDYFVTSGQGICTPEGYLMYLLCAKPYTNSEKTTKTNNNHNFVFYSTDEGATWHISDRPLFTGGDEAKLALTNDGSLIVSTRQSNNRGFNTATYTANGDGTLSFTPGTQYNNSQLNAGGYANNQDIFYYQRVTVSGKTDVIIHSMTTGQHANLKLYYSLDQGKNWTEFLNVQAKGTRYVTMEKSGTEKTPGSLYLFFEDQSLNSAGGHTDYNHYPLNFLEITREQLLQYIPDLDKSAYEKDVKIVYGTTGYNTTGNYAGGWISSWTSNTSSGVAGLSMTTEEKILNSYSSWNDYYNICVRPTAANTNYVLTLTAPEGYIIKGYKLKARLGSSTSGQYATVTAANNSSFKPAANAYTAFEVNGLCDKNTTITFNSTQAGKDINLADFTVTLESVITYTRSITPDRWGTICVPGAVAAAYIKGAEIYRIAGKVVKNELPTELKLEQINNLEAGKPYLFLANSNLLSLTYLTSATTSTPRSENGLIGSFTGMDVAEGMYVLSNNAIVLCGTGCNIGANRAYIDMSQVPEYSGESNVKSIAIFLDDPDGIVEVESSTLKAGNNTIYDLSGRKVNGQLPKGIYIINSRKVVVK